VGVLGVLIKAFEKFMGLEESSAVKQLDALP
jgi:hypothetical protein